MHLQVFIQKPLGIRFGRGNDAGAYVTRVDASAGNIDERIEARLTLHTARLCSALQGQERASCVIELSMAE